MAKRGPQSELNDRNWDDEEEAEEAGVFKQASTDTLKKREIKKAKRRGADEGGGKAGAFGGFGGFGGLTSKTAAPPKTSQMFGLGGRDSSVIKPLDSGFKSFAATSDSAGTFSTGAAATSPLDAETGKNDSSYLHSLKALNESVLAWIKQHVDKNPYIILTPIFKDYEKYVASLEAKKTTAANGSSHFVGKDSGSDTKTATATTFSTFAQKKSTDELDGDGKKDSDKDTESKSKAPTFSIGTLSSTNGEDLKFSTGTATTSVSSGFVFGKAATSSISSGFSSDFSFGQSNSLTASSTSSATTTTAAATTGFSFGGSGMTAAAPFGGTSGFSFGTLAANKVASDKAQAGNSQEGGDEDEYVPPKPDVKEIKEDGSLFSKRCKLFHQKDGNWVERGVGNVHIKPLDEPKTQLLIRADTNLGNILLNINLTSALPTSRQGKNNVLLVCVPNPPLKEGSTDQTPIPMLIRVKTAEEADELLAKLEERKALL